MKLHIIILTLVIVLSTGIEFEHEAFQILLCSDKEQESFIGYDGEELWHADFDQKRGVDTSPNFIGHMTYSGFYERAISNLNICKLNLLVCTESFKSPPPEMDAPQTSIYPKDEVELGIQNTLVCHVTGFYPPSVNISWTKNNIQLTEGMKMSLYRPRTDGTFNIFSTLKFTPAEGDIYSCTVDHRALQGQPQTKMWDVDVALPGVGPSVFCGVGLTLGILGVATGTFFLVKGNYRTI